MIRASLPAMAQRRALRLPQEPVVRGVPKVSFSGCGSGGGGAGDISFSGGGLFYSPTLSTDFYELPRSKKEERLWYRWFYEHDPLVGRCIDLHSELPLSKVMLTLPKSKDHTRAKKILHFFEKMWDELNGWDRMLEISQHWWLHGEAFPFLEYDEERKQWSNITILDGGNIELEQVPFSSNTLAYLVPDSGEIATARKMQWETGGQDVYDDKTLELLDLLEQEDRLLLDTDPMSGSHLAHLMRRKSGDGSRGISILKRCLTTLLYRDKLRQAQTQISSRNMTPKHLVWADGLNSAQVDDLREQVDLALNENDFSIVTNFEVHWESIGANDRLLDLSSEYDITDQHLLTGLGLTREIVAGEGTWGSTRINLEVMNTEYLFFRSIMQSFVERHIFRPIAVVNGFVEQNEYGDLEVLYPRLSFTRLSIRDNEAVFADLFNLYQKGSLPIEFILELYNIDPEDVREKLEDDVFTLNDANFNEVLRGIYTTLGADLAAEPDIRMRVAETLGVKPSPLFFQPGGGQMSPGGGFGGAGVPGDFGGGAFGDLGPPDGGGEFDEFGADFGAEALPPGEEPGAGAGGGELPAPGPVTGGPGGAGGAPPPPPAG